MTRLPLSLALAGLILVGATSASRAQGIAPADYGRVNAALVETHALPRYERLVTATGLFATEAEGFCAAPGDASLTGLRERFHEAMDAWT